MNHLRTLPALLALLLFLSTKAFALDTRTRIFDPAFASLKVSCQEDFWSDPVIRNGTDTHVVVSFDEFVMKCRICATGSCTVTPTGSPRTW